MRLNDYGVDIQGIIMCDSVIFVVLKHYRNAEYLRQERLLELQKVSMGQS